MRPMLAVVSAFGLALGVMTATMTGVQAITIDTVVIGDPGNPNDPGNTSEPGIYGGVSYTYAIGKYEVNLSQYTEFLNAVAATDTYNLYNTNMGTDPNIAGIQRTGTSGSYTYSVIGSGLRPVTYVSWFDAARFANWMANGQPTGAQGNSTTENGAYTLMGAAVGINFTKNAINPNTGTTTTWWIPSEDEWYKAAYYQPASQGGDTDSYWLYPTASNTIAGNTIGVADSANYFDVNSGSAQNGLPSGLSDGGAYGINSASFYGTFDQGGNVSEWNDAIMTAGSSRGLGGGTWSYYGIALQSYFRNSTSPSYEGNSIGFRLASVPEPSTAVLMLMGGGAWLLWRSSSGKRKAESLFCKG